MPISPEERKLIIELKEQIVAHFGESEWIELGLLTGKQDLVASHHRLLRSLRFSDPDYEGHVLSVLQSMATASPGNLEIIYNYVQLKCPEAGENMSSENRQARRLVFSPLAFEIPNEEPNQNLVSVMMPYAAEFTPVYKAIQGAAEDAEIQCQRAKDIWEDSRVIQDIFALIFKSYLVVCDFSERNPNVFYEAGIAHTLGKHVIPIAQSSDDIPFDLQHHRYLKYLNNAEGRSELRSKLAERIKTLLNKRNQTTFA